MFKFFRRIRGQYKLVRAMHHINEQLAPFVMWGNNRMCPSNLARYES